MGFLDSSYADQYEALADIRRHCTSCGITSRTVVKGLCAHCADPDGWERDVREANRRAGEKARAAQERRGRLAFLREWHR